jgi:hypothetical protein
MSVEVVLEDSEFPLPIGSKGDDRARGIDGLTLSLLKQTS